MTTLVIGARGGVGRQVLDQLVAAGEPVRASVRDAASAGLPAGVPVVAADLTRPETLPAALACTPARSPPRSTSGTSPPLPLPRCAVSSSRPCSPVPS